MTNIDILPSKNSVDICRKELLEKYSFYSGRVLIYEDTSCTESIQVPFTKVDDLKEMVKTTLENYEVEDLKDVRGEKTLVFSGDRGGNVGFTWIKKRPTEC